MSLTIDTLASVDDRKKLTAILKDIGILPEQSCQVILHCLNGSVNAIELSRVKVG